MRTAFRIVQVGDLHTLLWVHGTDNPSREEWSSALAIARTYVEGHRLENASLRTVVVSEGGAPDACQRAEVARERWSTHKVAVVTGVLSNPIKRGIATALGWLNPNIRFFVPADMEKALAHVDLLQHAERMMNELADLQAELCAPTRAA